MKRLSPRFIAAIAVAAGIVATAPTVASAQEASPIVQYRKSIMDAFRIHTGALRAVNGGVAPAGHVRHHAVALQGMALALANVFPDNTAGPGSRALPAIWTNRDDFMNKVTAIQTATAQLVAAADSGDSERITAAAAAVQGTCMGCHTPYRGPAN